jgi:hypothetical protein
VGRYKAPEHDWWRKVRLETFDAYWGGEVAAAALTQHLKPQIVTVYTKQDPAQLLLRNRMIKHHRGDVEVIRTFWDFEDDRPHGTHGEIVHPILVYADLLATGDDRNAETAKIIYEQQVTRYLRED